MTNKFYITTTIPYANAEPHIGFALEIVQADVLARWNKQKGKDVFFLTGTDEHGHKNYKMAKEAGVDTKKFVDANAALFKKLVKELNISNNNFIRTTDEKEHWPGVVELWKKLVKNGDIYKKKYKGNYCVGCERFITDKDLVEAACPNHPNLEIEKIEEENYFFRLSKYSDKIIDLIKTDNLKISPEKWKNDFLALVKEGLTDISFSREKKHLPWGIPVPGDENQTIYVWSDALPNYLTGIGYPDEKYKKYWPADIHLVGKDMLRFHTGIWPGMLLSAGLPLPKEVIVHGFLVVDGKKMSKSLGNVVSPLELRKKYSADSIRYYLLRNVPFGDDGDFSEKGLIERHNGELANKLGNLISRVSGLIEKNGVEKCDNKLIKKLSHRRIETHFEKYEFDKVLNEIFAFIDTCNEYTQNKKPWETGDKKVLYELKESILEIAKLLWAFIPESSEKITEIFSKKKIEKAPVLFEKIENDKINKDPEVSEIMTGVGSVNFEDWENLDLRVAQVKQAEDIEGADKLYKITLDVGHEIGERVVCAGLKEYYSKEDLKGKKVIYFANLKPRKMRGIESQGMVLAASTNNHEKVILLKPKEDVSTGSEVSFKNG